MNLEPKVEIKVSKNKVYVVRLTVDEKGLTDLFVSHEDGYRRNYNGFSFEKVVTELFAAEYVKRNYDTLATMIDLDTVKMMATKRLAQEVLSSEKF